jgi:hypothetical protein
MYLKKKPIPNDRKRNFIIGDCIIFSDFFCLVMFYEPQTWSLMADENLHIIYIDFIHPSHLTVGLKLIWSEIWIPKCCCTHSSLV